MVVRKIISRAMKKAVWPKRLACLVGLSQTEEITCAMTSRISGRRAGEEVRESLPRIRLLTHQEIREILASKVTK